MNLKVLEKSRKLLVQVMGQEDFDKFMEDGKIEIKHYIDDEAGRPREVVYELDQDARVYNRTKSESYCIEPIAPSDLPLHDQLAIKYSYLKNNIKRVEEVANKRSTAPYRHPGTPGVDMIDRQRRFGTMPSPFTMRIAGTNDTELSLGTRDRRFGFMDPTPSIPRRSDYNEYITYLEHMGLRRNQITLDERNTRISTINNINNINRNSNVEVIDIRCPAGQRISIMGVQQIAQGADTRTAHALRAKFADEEGREIPYDTHISIRKERVTEDIVQLARSFYSDISPTLRPTLGPIDIPSYKTDDQWYRFRQGVELNGEDHLKLYVENCESNISARHCKFALDCDIWTF